MRYLLRLKDYRHGSTRVSLVGCCRRGAGFPARATAACARAHARTPAAPAASPADARLNAAYDRMLAETMSEAPEFATSLGFDTGPSAELRHKLGNNSYGAIAEDLARNRRARATVAAVDSATLSAQARIDREVVFYNIRSNMVAPERFGLGCRRDLTRSRSRTGCISRFPNYSTPPIP